MSSYQKKTEIKINGVNLSQITDEHLLTKLINSTDDANLRKTVTARLEQLRQTSNSATKQRTAAHNQPEENTATTTTTRVTMTSNTNQKQPAKRTDSSKLVESISSHREQMIQQRQKDAADSKKRMLQMYDNMAKSGSAGDHRPLDINTYRGKEGSVQMLSGTALQKTDLVEETIRERVRASEENKKRLLAAYDYAAKTQPAGTVRDVDFHSFSNVDVSSFEQQTPTGSATFKMTGGVPKMAKAGSSVPSTPVIDIKKAPSFTQEQPQLDAYERALRQRKQEADERKRRTLAAYDAIARSGVAGPKIVVREELEHMEIPEDNQDRPKFSCTSSFSGGYAKI